MRTRTENPFHIGDTVYILGRYMPDASEPIHLLECQILHTKNRCFVAYPINGEGGEWLFSRKHFNKSVFKDKERAIAVWKEILSTNYASGQQ